MVVLGFPLGPDLFGARRIVLGRLDKRLTTSAVNAA